MQVLQQVAVQIDSERRVSLESPTDAQPHASVEAKPLTNVSIGATQSYAAVPESRVWALQKTEMKAITAALVLSLADGGSNTVSVIVSIFHYQTFLTCYMFS